MLNITKLAKWLRQRTEWQETPMPMSDKDYISMVIDGIERLFVDTGRSTEYDEEKYVMVQDSDENYPNEIYLAYDADFPLDERRYIQLCSEINFFSKVQCDVNDRFSYSTDAITVTKADKPYENLKDTIEKLDNERRIIYYKMVRYTLVV